MSIGQIQIKSLEHLLHKRQAIAAINTLPVGLPDAAVYCHAKQASFFSKREQRWNFFFFQGLNTNPQNLSIYLIDEAKRETKNSKQKLVKGVFIINDLFSRLDVVIEINVSGSCLIYKLLNGKKEMVSNEETNLMYLSAHFRSMYQTNLPWGRYYTLFQDSKNYLEELKRFYNILFLSTQHNDVALGAWFEADAPIKGSHGCSLVLNYMKDRKLVRQSIEIIEELFAKNKQLKACPKFSILLAQFYLELGKVSASLELIYSLLQKHPKDPYLLYYQSKYLLQASMHDQALKIANSIVQYNQFEIWTLLASIHLELKNFGNSLVCLNTAVKLAKVKPFKNLDIVYQAFEELGKIRHNSSQETIEYIPKLMVFTDSPLNIPIKQVQQKDRFLIEKTFWKLNPNEKIIYAIAQDLRYRLETKKFEELLLNTFEDNIKKYDIVNLRKGFGHTNAPNEKTITEKLTEHAHNFRESQPEQIPNFLKDSLDKVDETVIIKASRNLSIIPEIESVIQNSNYEQKQKDNIGKLVRHKREVQQGLFKIIQAIMSESDFEKAEYENNVALILKVYNYMTTISKFNNYYTDKIFRIFMESGNYNSIVILVGHYLDFLEKQGVRKLDKLPNWMHKYLFFIIEEKGLKYLNDRLAQLEFFDQTVIDVIEVAKSWKMKGVTY